MLFISTYSAYSACVYIYVNKVKIAHRDDEIFSIKSNYYKGGFNDPLSDP